MEFIFKLIINVCGVVAGALAYPIGVVMIVSSCAGFGRDISSFCSSNDMKKAKNNIFRGNLIKIMLDEVIKTNNKEFQK